MGNNSCYIQVSINFIFSTFIVDLIMHLNILHESSRQIVTLTLLTSCLSWIVPAASETGVQTTQMETTIGQWSLGFWYPSWMLLMLVRLMFSLDSSCSQKFHVMSFTWTRTQIRKMSRMLYLTLRMTTWDHIPTHQV